MTTLEILHWNDVHARFDGLARLSARAREIRESAPHPVLLLDAGDVEDTGVRLSALTYGVAGWRMLRAAGVDAAALGNGGMLRYGLHQLPRYAAALGAPPVVCDLEAPDGKTPEGAAPSRLLRAGDLRVGVIGTTDYYPQYDGYGLRERGRVTAVRREADALRADGADVVVLLSHAGIDQDRGLTWSLRGKVDLVVSGHTHDPLPAGDRGFGVPMVHAGCYAQYLGRVLLEVDRDGVRVADMRLEEVPADSPGDAAVVAERARCEEELERWLAEPVARLEQQHPHDPHGESAMAHLVARALLDHRPGELALLVAGHCSTGLPAGLVTRGNVWDAVSSPGNAATATLSGAELLTAVRRGRSPGYATTVPRTFRGRPYGQVHLVAARATEKRSGPRDGAVDDGLLIDGDPVTADRRYRVTGTDLELSAYGGLLDADPSDREVVSHHILPELLERYLATHHPV